MSNGNFYFENLEVYQDGLKFVVKIYEITRKFPREELYGLVNQLRRASVSIVSNISEGSSKGKKELSRYLDIARGSVFECVTQLRVSLELQYLDKILYEELYKECIKLSSKLMAFKKVLN